MSRIFETLTDAARELNSGGVLLLQTDTLPGLHARADRMGAVAHINSLKGRTDGKPLLVLAADMAQVEQVVAPLTEQQRAFCGRCWPGPFSLILDAAVDLSPGVAAENGSIAVRVPDLGPLQQLLQTVGFPLVSTSANRAGQPPCTSLTEATELFGTDVAGVWQAPQSLAPDTSDVVPSAVVDVRSWPPFPLRRGPRAVPNVEPDLGGGS